MKLIHIQPIPNYTSMLWVHIYMHMCMCVCMCVLIIFIYAYACLYVYGGEDINVILDDNLAVVSVS